MFYTNGWVHPLTPYTRNSKLNFPSPISGTQLTADYRDWAVLTLEGKVGEDTGQYAKPISRFLYERSHDVSEQGRLWCFGYVAESANVKAWYDVTLPFLVSKEKEVNIRSWSAELISAANGAAEALTGQVKSAWLSEEKLKSIKSPTQKKTLKNYFSGFEQSFWRRSENDFYSVMERLFQLPANQRQAPPEIYQFWEETIRTLAFDLFDTWALESPAEDADMKRIIKARNELKKQLNTNKAMKTLRDKSSDGKEGK